VVTLLLAAVGVVSYMVWTPGRSHSGPLPPLRSEERAMAVTLKRHVETVAAEPRNLANPDELEAVARYLETALEALGYEVRRQVFAVDGINVRNIEVVIPSAAESDHVPTIVVGAHYDSVDPVPGANDNASGVAALLELARLLKTCEGRTAARIRLVFFVNEEPPHFQTEDMGSVHYAAELKGRGENVVAMYAFDEVGYYRSEAGSQRYPPPFDRVLPDTGDFIAFVGLMNARSLLSRTIGSFRSHTEFPSVGGVAPDFVPGIGWSDHWSFAMEGFPALMITDTALFRYPHYTPDKVDCEKLARVVKGMERVIREIASAPQGHNANAGRKTGRAGGAGQNRGRITLWGGLQNFSGAPIWLFGSPVTEVALFCIT